MLNNGHGGMGTPSMSPHHHPMYGGGGGPGGGPMDYGNPPSSYNMGPSPPSMNGMSGHHSGGYCSQMSVNPNNSCPPITNSKLGNQCAGCGAQIIERYLLFALERYWHHHCLRCNQCQVQLAEAGQTCFTRDNLILCRQDYQRMYGAAPKRPPCNGCGSVIGPEELVMRAGVASPGSNQPLIYHVKCFNCSKCSHQLNTGDRYSYLNGALLCENDALKYMKNGLGSPSTAQIANTNGPTVPPKKGKVGRPRRSRD